ncbi:hypothetical protein NFHSH190041_27520 [Shewanella sp. NFH-SH190041]|nr:hypothetical protein NFHSH190041_27520 [Shewanella sp. NFH-SH190041]
MGLCMTLVFSNACIAAEASSPPSWLDKLLETFGASDSLSQEKGIDWGVLPGPFVNPKQGFGLGVAAIGLYSPAGRQADTQISSVSIKSYVSTSGSYGLGVENRTYFSDDSIRLSVDGWISHAPSDYWGIGRSAAEQQQNKSEVESQILQLSPKISYRLLTHTYATLGWDFQSYSNIHTTGSALTPAQTQDAHTSGVSLGLAYDSRDFALNAYSGILLSAVYESYNAALGSDHSYDSLILNYRQYSALSKNLVLAWELYGQGLSGDVPWFAMSQIGIDGRMRGYYQGQYRDKYQLSGQIELRQHLAGRHGLVYWLGGGNVASERQQLFNQAWLPTIGIGYRLAFKPRVNIRFDFGVGKDTTGFYFQINEAF